MKKIAIVSALILSAQLTYSQQAASFSDKATAAQQQKVPQKEVGLVLYGLNNFGLTYRVGNQKSLWRFNALSSQGSRQDQTGASGSIVNISSRVGVGRETRKMTNDKLEFRIGVDLNLGHNFLRQRAVNAGGFPVETKQHYLTPSLNMVLGLNYLITDNLIIGAEFLPRVNYAISLRTSNSNPVNTLQIAAPNTWSFSANASSALVSLVYRFEPKR